MDGKSYSYHISVYYQWQFSTLNGKRDELIVKSIPSNIQVYSACRFVELLHHRWIYRLGNASTIGLREKIQPRKNFLNKELLFIFLATNYGITG